jgi:type II secretory ATPase GspE/PulE/Tfp pilus assembly ATPase PilB-like protein
LTFTAEALYFFGGDRTFTAEALYFFGGDRRNCPAFSTQSLPSVQRRIRSQPEQLSELGLPQDVQYTFYRGKGCSYCMQTTYRGRIGIFEFMRVSDKIREAILQKQPAAKITEIVAQEGMTTLKKAAVEKVTQGITTIEEIKRVIFNTEG